MQTTQCPVCSSDVVIEDGLSEKDLVTCLNCGAELEIVTLSPLVLEPLESSGGEEVDE
jgi:lysine biosynthesis protein LysW